MGQPFSDDDQDRLWLSRVADGGREGERALEALFRKYRRPLLAFLLQRRVEREEAEDLVQEAFVRVVRGASGFRGEAKVSSWLFQIARNLHLDQLRRSNLEDTLDDDGWARVEGALVTPAACEAPAAMQQALQDCFDNGWKSFGDAHPQAAQVLEKVVQHDWSIRDVAGFLERTEGATREYLSQCRKKLRRFVEPCRELLAEV
jgi:RNA polymerase sigma-70 factor (ECF subfamily)